MNVYIAEFRERAALRVNAADKVRELLSRPQAETVRPVHVGFTGAEAETLRAIAECRGETPQALAKAVLAAALRDGYAEQVLADARAEALAPGHGRRPVSDDATMTARQCAVLYLIGSHGGLNAWCAWSATALERLLAGDLGQGSARHIIDWLCRNQLVERGERVGNMPRLMRLTTRGAEIYAELAGDLDG